VDTAGKLGGRPEMPGLPGMPLGPMGPGGPGGPPPEGFVIPMADVSHIRRKWLDIAYAGVSPTQQLDIYLPDSGEGPFPVVIHIHGGGFAIGDKRDMHLDQYLPGLERGYALVSINYRMSGEAIFPAAVEDVQASIRWMRAHGKEYQLDPGRIAACGASAGGNLAAMASVMTGLGRYDNPALGNVEYSSDVQVAVDMFGPMDFLKMDEQASANGVGLADHGEAWSPESKYLGGPVAEMQDQARRADPSTYAHMGMAPILIQHGTADALVPYQQSVEFARVVEERAGSDRFELDLFEGAGHQDPAFHTEENVARVYGFLDRHLK
jgi:acetyl esterase/lipase